MTGPVKSIRFPLGLQAALIIAVPVVLVLVIHAFLEYREDRQRLSRGVEQQALRIAEMMQATAQVLLERDEYRAPVLARGKEMGRTRLYRPSSGSW